MTDKSGYTETYLMGLTKLQIKRLYTGEFGLSFEQGMSKPDMMQAILAAQAAQGPAAASPTPTASNTPTPSPARSVAGKVLVSCGGLQKRFSVAGQTVGKVRKNLRDALNIQNDMNPRVNGQSVNDKHVLEADDELEFIKPSGEKA